ncbi:uncharacterized protein LDX57_000079 [Aspergillus melleus]|uniref:uncharacterized protein n=1 Tax=Aspergillus melleus TaxID=138277 RepID=UPI001E8E8C62|nr:uncharacterized protein LDX57_000079 [Aspergillus melleus]KAH8422322.1 hypothetical protein LDX57_000079 [Aspergillus melleus]
MGLGKTLLAILVMEQARKEHGSFSLVVCPASCRLQWQKEILNAYNPGLVPKVLLLDDMSMSVHQLLDESYEIVIVSYNFLGASHRANLNFAEMFSRYVRCERPRPSRPICALTSDVWKLVNLPFKRVILDECQKVKNEKGVWYNAVKSLHHNGIVMLSGTVLANRWHDIGAPLTLLRGHPFETKEKFLNAFASDDDKDTSPTELLGERLVQLQRFLMGVLIARPASILNLPLLTESSAVFKLNDAESQNVLEATNKFVRARFHSSSNSDKAGIDGESLNPLGHAVRAQLLAAHPLLPSEHNCEGVEGRFNLDIDDGIDENVVRIIEAQSGISSESRNEWLSRLDAQDTETLMKSTRGHAFLEIWDRVSNSWPGKKAIIFRSYLKFLDILAVVLKRQRGAISLRFDGSLDDREKESVKDDFMTANSSSPLLITTGCGGTGINLQAASVVIQMEPWWNRNHEKQAYATDKRGEGL